MIHYPSDNGPVGLPSAQYLIEWMRRLEERERETQEELERMIYEAREVLAVSMIVK